MRRAAFFIATVLLWGGTGPAQAEPASNPQKVIRLTLAAVPRPAPAIAVGLVEAAVPNRIRVANCANLAAVRAMGAKTMGASYSAQDRILDLTFVLCMAGPQSRD